MKYLVISDFDDNILGEFDHLEDARSYLEEIEDEEKNTLLEEFTEDLQYKDLSYDDYESELRKFKTNQTWYETKDYIAVRCCHNIVREDDTCPTCSKSNLFDS